MVTSFCITHSSPYSLLHHSSHQETKTAAVYTTVSYPHIRHCHGTHSTVLLSSANTPEPVLRQHLPCSPHFPCGNTVAFYHREKPTNAKPVSSVTPVMSASHKTTQKPYPRASASRTNLGASAQYLGYASIFKLFTCYVPDNPWLASLHTTSKDQGQVGANERRKHSSSSPRCHHTGLSELRGKKQQQPTIYNLAWRDAHARTTQESHLARAMRDLRSVRRTPSQPTGSYNITPPPPPPRTETFRRRSTTLYKPSN